jgi:SET domain-containing protein
MRIIEGIKICTSPDRINAKESDYLFVAKSQIPDSGNGLFTSIPIYKDEIIAVFKGELLSSVEAKKRSKNNNDKYFINMPDGSVLDSMHVKCFAKYANDSNGNIKSKFNTNAYIAFDYAENVCIVANKNIKSGEEVFCTYGKKYWEKRCN